jgi:hypothetical protein
LWEEECLPEDEPSGSKHVEDVIKMKILIYKRCNYKEQESNIILPEHDDDDDDDKRCKLLVYIL